MTPNGQKLWSIKGPGSSPYEIQKPISFAFNHDETKLLLLHKQYTLTVFDAETGRFLRQLPGFHPYGFLLGWQNEEFIALTSPFPVKEPGLVTISMETTEVTRAWFQLAKHPQAISVASLALDIMQDGTVFYQEGASPEVHEIAFGKTYPQTWPLKPARGYVEPPQKPIPERDRYSRVKVDAYYNGFSKVKRFQVLDDRFLLVC